MGLHEASIRKIRGDGLSVRLRSNEEILEVTGDGCTVTVTMNYGSVKIIGDGCHLRIDRNMGDVEYTGDGGRVLLGAKSVSEKVKYIGDGGRVSFDGESRTKKSKEAKQPVGSMDETVKGGGIGHGRGGLSRERVENLSNEKKDGECKKQGREKSSKARVVTTFDCGDKKWMTDPVTVVRNLDNVSFVRIGPKKTTIVVK